MNSPETFSITVVVADRVGVLRDVAKTVFVLGGNLVDLRQAVVCGCFTLTCIAQFEEAPDGAEGVAAALRGALVSAGDANPGAHVHPYDLKPAAAPAGGERYVFAVDGVDRPGRVYRIAQIFAEHGVNVEDWSHVLQEDAVNAFNSGTVTVPAGVDTAALQREFTRRMAECGYKAALLHENIFRATNGIGPIHSLLDEAAAAAHSRR